jgi:hypothetical protein
MPKLIRDLSPDERAEWVKLCPEFDRIGPDHPINGKMSWGEHSLPLALRPLANHNRWLVWKWVATDGGKLTKPPFQAAAGMRHAANNEPATWCDYARAKTYVDRGLAHGAGFVLTDFNVCAFDLDHCFAPDGTLYPSARVLVDGCNSYTEWTPSGDGLRIIGTDKPEGKRQRVKQMPEGWSLECYEAGAKRYITVTGIPFENFCGPVRGLGAIFAGFFEGYSEQSETEQNGEVGDWGRFVSAVMAIPNDGYAEGVANWERGLDRDTVWVPLGACIYRTGHIDAWKLFLAFSQKSRKFRLRETQRVWKSFERNPSPRGRPWTPGSIFKIAADNGWNDPILGEALKETVTRVTDEEWRVLGMPL